MFLSSVVTVKWTNYAEEVPAISTDLKLERSLLSIGRYLSPIQQLENRNKKLLSFFYFQFKAHTSKSLLLNHFECVAFFFPYMHSCEVLKAFIFSSAVPPVPSLKLLLFLTANLFEVVKINECAVLD